MTTETPEQASPAWSRVLAVGPYVLAAVLFAMGTLALIHLLRPVHLLDVVAEVRATPVIAMVGAVLATLASYVTLVGCDWNGLRYFGHRLPLRVTAFGSFTGYAIGGTVGAGPVTGGAVRYRIYAALGLKSQDVAKLMGFSATLYGVAQVVLILGALALDPAAFAAVLPASAWLRPLAVGLLVALIGGLLWLGLARPELRLRGHCIMPPGLATMGRQIALSAIDITLAASVLYLLLPGEHIGIFAFVAVFAAAMAAGAISHVPGGIGVFESVILAALPAGMPLEQAVAALFLYRLIYTLGPFALALVTFAVLELRLAGADRAARAFLPPLLRVVSSAVPATMGALVFVTGAFLLLSAVVPPASIVTVEIDHVLPVAVIESGALLSSALGAALVLVARGLMRRVAGAWWLAVIILGGSAAAVLAHSLSWGRAGMLLAVLLVLLPTRREFYRTARLTRQLISLRWLLLVLALGATVLALFFFAYKATPYSSDLWWQFAADSDVPRALRASFLGVLALLLMLVHVALRPGAVPVHRATRDDLDRAAAIIAVQDDPEPNIVLTGDKSVMFSESGESFLMYGTRGRTWVALHAPCGVRAELGTLAWDFIDAARRANARPVFYAVPASSAHTWIDLGLALYKMGEEAVVPLDQFSLEGKPRKRLRTSHNRALRDGFTFEMLSAPVSDAVLDELKQISDAWLQSKAGAEKSFSVGAFDRDYLRRFPIAVIRLEGRIVAFANLWMTDTRHKASIDLMRHLDDIPSGVMEFLFTELLLHLKSEGFAAFSLGNAPLAGLQTRPGAPLSSRIGALIYSRGGRFYNFEGLRAFKSKFDPDWQPVYVALDRRSNVLGTLSDVVGLIGGGLSGTLQGRTGAGKSG